jgi:hypothetical protein
MTVFVFVSVMTVVRIVRMTRGLFVAQQTHESAALS